VADKVQSSDSADAIRVHRRRISKTQEIAMSQPTPSFPAFDEWQKMSESEQDALLDRLETAKQDSPLIMRVLMGLLGVAVCAAVGAALLAIRL
jgi:hypothetical protein